MFNWNTLGYVSRYFNNMLDKIVSTLHHKNLGYVPLSCLLCLYVSINRTLRFKFRLISAITERIPKYLDQRCSRKLDFGVGVANPYFYI